MSTRQYIKITNKTTGDVIFRDQYLGNNDVTEMGWLINGDYDTENIEDLLDEYRKKYPKGIVESSFICYCCEANSPKECTCGYEDDWSTQVKWFPTPEEFTKDLIEWHNQMVKRILISNRGDIKKILSREFTDKTLTSLMLGASPYISQYDMTMQLVQNYFSFSRDMETRKEIHTWGDHNGNEFEVEIECY